MLLAETPRVQQKYTRFTQGAAAPPVFYRCLHQGNQPFTFSVAPRAMERAGTTKELLRINEEFRPRTKTRAGVPGHDAAVLLLFGLLRNARVTLRMRSLSRYE
jgi:hypothetical protein